MESGLEKAKYLYLSSLCWVLSLYTYSSARVFVPLFIFGLFIFHIKKLRKLKRHVLLSILGFFLLSLPAAIFWFTPQGMARATATLNLSDFLPNYLSYFSPNYLFFKGDTDLRLSVARIGQLHYFEIVTVPLGLVFVVKDFRRRWLVMLWLALHPVAAAVTAPTHALRSLMGSVAWAMVSAYGISGFYRLFSAKFDGRAVRAAYVIFAIIALLNIGVSTKTYFKDYPRERETPNLWQYGYREAIRYAEEKSYTQIIISDRLSIPHIFVLFYTEYPPDLYQKKPLVLQQNKWRYTDYTVGKYHILNVNDRYALKDTTLFIIRPPNTKTLQAKYSKEHSVKLVKMIRHSADIPWMALVEVSPLPMRGKAG